MAGARGGSDRSGTGKEPVLVRSMRAGALSTVVMDSPHNRNALSTLLVTQLLTALHEVQADPEVRAVVLTGTGSVFCSGADLSERLGGRGASAGGSPPGGDDNDNGDHERATFADVLSCLAELPQPVVARVNGHVRAGGMGLVAACDLAVAPVSATFAFNEVRIGLAPAMIAVPALRVMDRRAFARWALTGDTFTATQAAAAGLLSAVVEDGMLDDWVEGVVESFLRSSPLAMAATKGLVEGLAGREWDPAMASAEALSDELFASDEAAEGMAAFLEKRAPAWVVDPTGAPG
ncbi:MAG: enoyl-CoA hydratase-related protein [Acidimicrobiales bacterium]